MTTAPALARGRELAVDCLIAFGFAVLAEVQVWTVSGLHGDRAAIAALTGVLALTLLVRRRYPLAVVASVCLYFVVTAVAGWNTPDVTFFPSAALMLASYSVAAHGDLRAALIGAALVVAIGVAALVTGDLSAVGVFFFLLFNAASWSAGQLVRTRDEQVRTEAARSSVLERETAERTRVALAEERARIARELHDVVSHGLSGIMLEAAGAEHLAERDPDRVREALRSIQAAGAEANGELRRLLGMMRSAPAGRGEPPIPALADADELVARARRSGLDVDFTSDGELDGLPAGLQLAAYRIVQEALTNVVKHAHGAATRVALRREPGRLEVEVTDSGGRTSRGAKHGHGLVGMRERVALYGGDLDAGPLPGGGFRVLATFPLAGAGEP